jgi:hypothetical protein
VLGVQGHAPGGIRGVLPDGGVEAMTGGLCNGDILQEEGLWYLVRIPEYHRWESWVVHGCEKTPPPDTSGGFHHDLGYFVRVDQPDPTCMGCGLVCPDKFKTLWTLHNWSCIQGYYHRNPKK